MFQVFCKGKQGLDAFLLEIGRMMAETIMYIEREELAGPERGMSSQKYSETVIETNRQRRRLLLSLIVSQGGKEGGLQGVFEGIKRI